MFRGIGYFCITWTRSGSADIPCSSSTYPNYLTFLARNHDLSILIDSFAFQRRTATSQINSIIWSIVLAVRRMSSMYTLQCGSKSWPRARYINRHCVAGELQKLNGITTNLNSPRQFLCISWYLPERF